MTKILRKLLFAVLLAAPVFSNGADSLYKPATAIRPDAGNAGLKLPSGFGALMFAENIGRSRHIAVNKNGDVYIKLERLKNGKGIIKLRDKNGDGKSDDTSGFGNYGGTGIAIKNSYLYASSNTDIYRYKLNANMK
jgi:hypothetical protein